MLGFLFFFRVLGFSTICLPQEILQRYTARQLRLAFLSQLWNAKVDFTDALMTGEVRALETAINVGACLSILGYSGAPDRAILTYFYSIQNFFTNVSALVSQAKADGSDSRGHHHNYEEPERELRAL